MIRIVVRLVVTKSLQLAIVNIDENKNYTVPDSESECNLIFWKIAAGHGLGLGLGPMHFI